MIKNGFPDPQLYSLHISAIFDKQKIVMSLIFRDLSFENWLQQIPWRTILLKFCHNMAIRVADNNLMVRDKNPPPPASRQ